MQDVLRSAGRLATLIKSDTDESFSVKREASDVKSESGDDADMDDEFTEDFQALEDHQITHEENEVQTVELSNVQFQDAEQISIIINDYPENDSDGNFHIDADGNVIHTCIIENLEYGDHQIVFEDADDGETLQYVIEDDTLYEENSQSVTEYNESQIEYIYEEPETITNSEAEEEEEGEEDDETREEVVILNDIDTVEGQEEQDDEQEEKKDIIRLEDIKNEELIQCDICTKSFKTAAALKRHITVNHGAKTDGEDSLTLELCVCCGEPSDSSAHMIGDFKCEACDKLFLHENFLARHCVMEHPSGDKYVCCDCPKTFDTKEQVTTHLQVHPFKTIKCLDCNREFTRKYHLERHIGQTGCMGATKKVFDCRVCNKYFTRKDNLAEHLRAHAGQVKKIKRKYTCGFCNKEFQAFTLMNIHVRTHTGEKPFNCDLCPKKFPSSGAMKKHRRMHTGEKPYKCDQCDKRFAAKETLNRHWKTHTGEKPHICKFCGKSFIQPSQLRAHIFHHTGENAFTCPICGRAFNRKLRLTTHIKFMHEGAEPLPCDHPGCSKTFFRREDVARHMLCHTGEKPYSCEVCYKRFSVKSSLKIHQLTHRKEPPCSCETCGRAFIRKDCLMRHIRARHRDVLEDIVANAEKKRLQQQLLSAAAADAKDKGPNIVWNELTLTESVKELLMLLVDEECLAEFGYPEAPVDKVLDCVIKKCGHKPAAEEDFDYIGRLRENAKLLFTVVIDDGAVKELLNNQTVDEVIMHVLQLARKQKKAQN